MDSSHPARLLLQALAALALAGCSSYASVNSCLKGTIGPEQCVDSKSPTRSQEIRATLAVDGARGNPQVLMFLALSGGGSRASYLSTEAMIALRTFAGVDLLAEVDVMSAVSGGTLPAAFYAVTRDRTLEIDHRVALALSEVGAPEQLQPVKRSVTQADQHQSGLRCDKPLNTEALLWLLQRDSTLIDTAEVWRIRAFCEQARLDKLREWSDEDARERISRNYIARMLGNAVWPSNLANYLFTAYDRSDIMAQTLADNLYDEPVVGTDHRFADLNPTRPFLVLNATAASDPTSPLEYVVADDMAFGSSFTFTVEDFYDRVWSDLSNYPVANAVMASSAFPLAFPHVTLENFHTRRDAYRCKTGLERLATCSDERYLHLFDGGNSDNLGLRAIKRILLEMAIGGRLEDYDRVVVLLVDAFTRPSGASRNDADPRSVVGRIADPNGATEAVDALLQANRRKLLYEFGSADTLLDRQRDCDGEERHLPSALCKRLRDEDLDDAKQLLSDRLVVYHFGFHELKGSTADLELRGKLDRVPTSFAIDDEHKELIRSAVGRVINGDNACLRAIARLVGQVTATPQDVEKTRLACPASREANGSRPSKAIVAGAASPSR